MVKPKNSGKKLTGAGGSALGFGGSVSMASFATDRDVVQALVTILEDRRALYIDHHREFSEHVTASILEIREHITDALQQIDGKSPAVDFLRRMRAACRRYLDEVGPHHGRQIFGVALGELRATFGAQLQMLDQMFKLDMERQLREIFPLEDSGR